MSKAKDWLQHVLSGAGMTLGLVALWILWRIVYWRLFAHGTAGNLWHYEWRSAVMIGLLGGGAAACWYAVRRLGDGGYGE
jgi:hypothetical protein